jgi:polyhydroxybutyrate depolymerase
MKRVLRVVLWGLIGVVALVPTLGALFGYFGYSPAPEVPRLSGTLTKGTIEVGGLKRAYLTYVPPGLQNRAPLVDVCSIVGEVNANLNIDDMGFLTRMVDKLITEIGVDPGRVFATGGSRGGSMALRLALEAPARFRAVAAISANVPTPENFKCKPAGHRTSSVMIMNGTRDPLVPFDGGDVNLLGLFYRNGKVLSARQSGQYFANLNHITGTPERNETQVADGVRVEQVLWRNNSNVEVELVAIRGGGHGIPQPYRRGPRLLGPSPMEPNGPAVIWAFFERQRLRERTQ